MAATILLAVAAWGGQAQAQPRQVVTTCGTQTLVVGDGNNGYIDATGLQCGKATTTPSATTGNVGSLTATTVSATVASLITENAGNAASWPTASGNIPNGFYVRNFGNTDVAFCIHGGTCTCPENGVASTNGMTVQAGGGGYGFFGFSTIAYNIPTIVACSATDIVEIDQ